MLNVACDFTCVENRAKDKAVSTYNSLLDDPCVQLNTLVARNDEELVVLSKKAAGQGMYHLATNAECQGMVAAMRKLHSGVTLESKLTRRGKQRDHISLS